MPEQIAALLGGEILIGRYEAGRRMGEQEIAERFEVSRGPVREALRLLETRGLVEFFPRRGAFVVEHSLDRLADLFNTHAVYSGLAARCLTRAAGPEGMQAVEAAIEDLRVMAVDPACDPIKFAYGSARVHRIMIREGGNTHLQRLLRSGEYAALWDYLWRSRPLDFLTDDRRQVSIAQWEDVIAAARSGDELEAERIGQQILYDARDVALAQMAGPDGPELGVAKRLTNV